MSRKPDRFDTDDGPGGSGSDLEDYPVGRRYSGSKELLDIEAELVDDGVDLDNRAIPLEYHSEVGEYDYSDAKRVSELIETEASKDQPNRSLIGLLNEQLTEATQ